MKKKEAQHFPPPNPDSMVSNLEPDAMQQWASAAGRLITSRFGDIDALNDKEKQGAIWTAYRAHVDDIAHKIIELGEEFPGEGVPLSFKVEVPIERNEHGQEVPRESRWHFLAPQYLRCLASGVYPISKFAGAPILHDALHAAELSIIQKHCPEVGNLLISAAKVGLSKKLPERKHITEIIDFFTDTLTLDEFSRPFFTWRASEVYKIIDPTVTEEVAEKKAQDLHLRAVSAVKQYVAEEFDR